MRLRGMKSASLAAVQFYDFAIFHTCLCGSTFPVVVSFFFSFFVSGSLSGPELSLPISLELASFSFPFYQHVMTNVDAGAGSRSGLAATFACHNPGFELSDLFVLVPKCKTTPRPC